MGFLVNEIPEEQRQSAELNDCFCQSAVTGENHTSNLKG